MNACSQRSLSGATKNDLAGVKGTASSCALEKVGMDLVRLRSLGVSNQDAIPAKSGMAPTRTIVSALRAAMFEIRVLIVSRG
jgi:hypothetical protein